MHVHSTMQLVDIDMVLNMLHLIPAFTSCIVCSLAGEQRLHAIRQPSPDLTLDKDDLVNTMHQMNNGTLLVNTTLHGRIIVWDLRSGQIAWSEENPLEAGMSHCLQFVCCRACVHVDHIKLHCDPTCDVLFVTTDQCLLHMNG